MKYFLSLLSIVIVLFAVSQPPTLNIKSEIDKGLYYFNLENPTSETDKKALFYLEKIAKIEPKNKVDAALICQASEKTGVLSQTQQENQKAAFYYKKAINTAQKFTLPDSTVFPSLLYLSGIYYYNSVYDSCLTYLSKAEMLYEKNPKLPEAERLFNTKGVLLFESGNFRQSLAYFKKAESLAGTDIFSNRNNQALALQFMNQPDSTYKILKNLQKDFPNEHSLKINLASVLLELNRPKEALEFLGKIAGDSVVYFNTLGKTYFKLNDLTKAKENFDKSLRFSKRKNANFGFSHYYLGQIASQKNQDFDALTHFQSALQNFDFFFDSEDIYVNPSNFSTYFYSFSMLDILFQKAKTFEKLYTKTHKMQHLEGAMNTFEAMKLLTNNMSKTYNQEEARLDILDEIHPKLQAYIALLWSAYQNTKDEKYAIKAFEVSEEAKAAVLALSINENQLKLSSDIPTDLLDEERNLQITLAALRRNLENSSDEPKKYLNAINETQIKIGKLNEKLEKFPAYKRQKYEDKKAFSLALLRENLGSDDVIISYADLGDKALVFGVSKDEFLCESIVDKKKLDFHVKKLKTEILNNQESASNKYVYDQLFKPFEKFLGRNSNLIFVGEGFTNGLPIELLKTTDSEYLIEKYPISYLYSSKFILNAKLTNDEISVLAFAPFSESSSDKYYLPNSKNEVENISKAKTFLAHQANKKAFLNNYSNYNVLHLATHAVSDVDAPEKSFVRFSNQGKNQADDKLYLFEFSAGMLKNTSLVFLSACDSYGKTNLEGEGIRGLSRGFYLAGSQSIISSLWQAEDFATAYLSRHFYEHLQDGVSFQKALQLAKIDLLNDPAMAQFKSPKYWSHLIYVGYQKQENQWYRTVIVYIFACLAVFGALFYFRKNQFLRLKSFNFNK